MQDGVEKPNHYQFGQMEAWDIIELAVMDIADPVTAYHVASALKYLLRAARKGGDTDIAKASAHLKRETARHVTAVHESTKSTTLGHVALMDDGLPKAGTSIPVSGRAYEHHPDGSSHPYLVSAPELAAADGASEYGNPVTPGRLS